MTKDPRRKGKLRSRKPVIDDDLIELASVLAEYQLDNNAYGWFRPLWRNGEWAVALAKHVALDPAVRDGTGLGLEQQAVALIDGAQRNAETYEIAGKLHNEIVQPKINTNTARLLAASLRCLQLKIANSHGGGLVYNEVLIPAFLPIEPSLVEHLVLEFRCNDAIGTTHQLRGDRNDRQRHAFTVAWKRGLYLAAYSLPPAF